MKKIFVGLGIFTIILASAVLSIMIWPEHIANESINQTSPNITANISATPYVHQSNVTLVPPSNNQIVSPINWSKYPIFNYGGILKSEVEGPNEIINYTFIDVHIRVDISDPENVPEIYREMSSLVKAERAIIGPDSSVEVWGFVSDGRIFKAGMLPFSSEIYRRDYVHPVHNLTFSDIDASEVD